MALHHSQQGLAGVALQTHGQQGQLGAVVRRLLREGGQFREDDLYHNIYATGFIGRYATLKCVIIQKGGRKGWKINKGKRKAL